MKTNDKSKPHPRALSPEESRLWNKVTRTMDISLSVDTANPATVKGLRAESAFGAFEPLRDSENESVTSVSASPRKSLHAASQTSAEIKSHAAQPRRMRPQELDRKTRNKISRKLNSVDAVLDLHGKRQAEAHRSLRLFLINAQQRGSRFVIVITGKGSGEGKSDDFGYEGGVLRNMVPRWLSTHEFQSLVVGFSEASRNHGGGGALYVQLRKTGRPRPSTSDHGKSR